MAHKPPTSIASDRQLFVDDFWIAEAKGVTRLLQKPKRQEVALAIEHPWEGPSPEWTRRLVEAYGAGPKAPRISAYLTVIKDGDRYKMWYRCADYYIIIPPLHAYAESTDGVRWEKPWLGIIEYDGSNDNNLVWMGPGYDMGVFLDSNPAAADDERYKAIAVLVERDLEGYVTDALVALASPDGLHWRPMQEEPVLADPPHDTMHCAFWDERIGRYVMYTRGIAGTGDFTAGVRGIKPGVRWIRRTTSSDFLHWTPPEPIDAGDAPYEHLYSNVCVQYERAPGTYFMFPSRYVPERTPDPDWPEGEGVNDIVFMSSRDGVNFDRSFMEAFLRPGPDRRNWHERALYMERGILQTSPTELSMFATEHSKLPSAHLRRYTLRTDGFVSVNAGYSGGELITHPVVFTGTKLELNYSTSAVGYVRVEIQDLEGRPRPGFTMTDCPEIYGDEVEGVIHWERGGDVSSLAGQPVRLRFALRDADLFAFRFR